MKAAGEGQKRSSWSLIDGRGRRHEAAVGEVCEIACSVVVAAAQKLSCQLDDVTAGTAAGEAVPEVLAAIDDESRGIVAAMDRAGPDQAVGSPPQAVEQASVGEELLDGDHSFETFEVEMRWDHRPFGAFRSLSSL